MNEEDLGHSRRKHFRISPLTPSLGRDLDLICQEMWPEIPLFKHWAVGEFLNNETAGDELQLRDDLDFLKERIPSNLASIPSLG